MRKASTNQSSFEHMMINNSTFVSIQNFLLTLGRDANTLLLHVLNMIKHNNKGWWALRARIARPGSQYIKQHGLHIEGCIYPLVGLLIFMVIACFDGWLLIKADEESAILHSGQVQSESYVVPPKVAHIKIIIGCF